jgi:UDP-N-acetylglucosamine--N-acetylmuramyl-(pentapeptide) pyrophosphoryl-undecaprenol N-acetylglucosamine transferase
MSIKRAIISGGGTGGHIFPAIAIANRIKLENPDAEILFIGAEGKMEMEKVPAAGYKIEGLWISGFQRRLTIKNLMLPFKIIASMIKARGIIKKFKPDVVIGVGGYASGPTLKVATQLGIPTVIQEQNSFPGKTNKLLATKVSKICVAYEGLDRFFPKNKIEMTGNPVREDVVHIEGKRAEAFSFFGLDINKKTVFIVGGSLGARTLNESIKNQLDFFADNSIQLIWQCGKFHIESLKSELGNDLPQGIVLTDFISRMDYAYASADVIISRAGAIAVSELCLIGKPIILVPSPNVAEDHQTKNAMALVEKNAAILVKDVDSRTSLVPTMLELLENKEKRIELSIQISKMAIHEADAKIVKVINEVLKSA